MYERGQGVEADGARAAELYEKASDVGIAEARLNLSILFARGEGVPRDAERALMWLDMAEASGLAVRGSVRETLLRELTPEQVAAAERKAAERLAGSVRNRN